MSGDGFDTAEFIVLAADLSASLILGRANAEGETNRFVGVEGIAAGAGNDLFCFAPGFGTATITDVEADFDRIEFADFPDDQGDPLFDTTQVGSDAVIHLGIGDAPALTGMSPEVVLTISRSYGAGQSPAGGVSLNVTGPKVRAQEALMAGQVITIAQQKGGSGKTTLAVNLAVAFQRQGLKVALVDTDPQGSLGRWFMMRLDERGEPDIEFTTATAWGIGYEMRKLTGEHDIVIIDTPPKIDSDLKPSLRAADLILVPVASSHVDLWATEGLVELAERVDKSVLVVMNRTRPHTRLGVEIAELAADSGADVAEASLGNRVVYAESLGKGRGALEAPRRGVAGQEVEVLAAEVLARLSG